MPIDIENIFSVAQKKAKETEGKEETQNSDLTLKEDDAGVTSKNPYGRIVDVITFAESGSFLEEIELFPWQRIVLKAAYMGTIGNEHLRFTDEEWQLMEADLDEENFISIKQKYGDGTIPRVEELVLCLGRRSFKSFLTSILALYEAYKMLSIYCPQRLYNIPIQKPIWVINVATNKEQAKIVFEEIEMKVTGCDFFRSRLGEHIVGQMRFLTDYDVDSNNNIGGHSALKESRGSVVIVSGNSNSAGLRGHAAIVIIYDEIAHFIDSNGKHSDSSIYDALQPSLKTFIRMDENGVKHSDGKSILISSPSTKSRVFYKQYMRALKKDENGVAFRLPTWKANPKFSKEDFESEYKNNPNMFMQEYAAEFSYGGLEAFFTTSSIDDCVERGMANDLQNKTMGDYNKVYYMHVDPGKSSDNYALAIIHAEPIETEEGEHELRIILDHAKIWIPVPVDNLSLQNAADLLEEEDMYNVVTLVNGQINPSVVDDYVIDIAGKFKLSAITYDHWESSASIKKLSSMGLPVSVLTFAGSKKSSYYSLLYKVVTNGYLDLFPSPIVADELKFLQKKHTRGGWIVDKLDNEHTDDIADCLAAATFNAYKTGVFFKKLPRSLVVRTSFR